MRRVAVIGVGITKFGKHDCTSAELFAQAAADAIVDAEIAPSEVQALYYGNVTGGETEHQLHMGPLAATTLGVPSIPTTRFENACATSHAAFRHAVMEIASCSSDIVMVGGGERVLNIPTEAATEYFAYCSDASFEQPAGLTFPGVFALIARAHMDKYGTTEEQMAHVAVKNHRHGVLNPKAQFQKEITLDTVLKSAYVADPLKLFDCCPFTDGGAAVILAAEEIGRKRPRAVWVLGSQAASDTMFMHEKRDLSRVTATERAAAAVYRQAGKTPTDIDVGRRLAGLPVDCGCGPLGRGHAGEVALLVHEHGVRGRLAAEHPDGAWPLAADLLGGQDDGGAAIGEGAAVEELERVGDVGALEDRVERDLLLELRLGIEDAVAVVLHGHVGHLLLGRPVLVHVGAGDQGEDAGKRQPDGLLEGGVGAVGEVLGRRVRRDTEYALGAADQDDVRDAGGDLHQGVAEGGMAGGAGVLETGGGDGRKAQERGGQWPHVQLLLAGAAGDIAVVESLDGRGGDISVTNGLRRGLGEQLGAGA